MKHCLRSVLLRFLLGVLLLAAVGGCKLFHPYRLPTPKPSPEFKAQQKAAKKARKAEESRQKKESGDNFFSKFKKKSAAPDEEAASDVSTPTGSAAAPPADSAEARTLPEHSTVKYDKHGLMKKPKLMRRRINKRPAKPFRPWQSIRNFFKYDLHAKPNYSPNHRPAVPAPTSEPDALPDAAPGSKP